MSVQWREPFEDSVRQCAEQGVDVVEVPTWASQCTNVLALLRKYGVKGFTHSGFNPSQDVRPAVNHGRPCERAVCSGGAYCGLSIDRILEAWALAWGVDNGLQYDVFELPPAFAGVAPATSEALSSYPLVVSTIPLPGVANVRVLGENTEGTTIASSELVDMRRVFAAEIAGNQR